MASQREISRRTFLSAAAAAAALACSPLPSIAARKPNVIVILTDDQGTIDAPGFGATDLHMPNVDALGNRGVQFTQFYAGAPVCSPSRAALLTGKYPVRAGMPDNAASDDREHDKFAAQTTLADVFRRAGYATAHIGKWHLGSAPNCIPNARGFDYSFGHMNGCIDSYSHFFYWSGPNRHDLRRNGVEVFEDGTHFLDLMVRETKAFIQSHQDQPFFIYFAANSPHYPYQPDAEWLAQCSSLPYPRNLYAAFLATLDERIGEVIRYVDDLGIRDDTIIVFQSDNGHSTEERAHFGGGSAGAYRGEKFSLFEGGIRVPAIISWPGHLPEGVIRNQIAHACDWMPTLTKLAGIDGPDEIDGRNIADVISADARTPHDVLHWQVGTGDGARWAVRKGDWKLIVQPEGGKPTEPFLVNLKDDLSETRNVAADSPAIAAELRALHDAWASTL